MRAWERARPVLEAAGAEIELVRTRGHGHATELAEAASRAGWPIVLALGGDGTVHEVANGLLNASDGDCTDAALGIVPSGTGNDFAALAGMPRDPVEAARRIVSGTERRVDAGQIDGAWFTNGVGIGLDARVAIEANRMRKLRGIVTYLLALGKVLRRFSPPTIRVEVDGEEVMERPMTLVTVGNGGRHGGGFWLCPDARIDDGVLDLCVCDGLTTGRIVRILPKTLWGKHVGESCVHMRTVRRVRITSDAPLPVHADGEILHDDAHALDIAIAPGRLRIAG